MRNMCAERPHWWEWWGGAGITERRREKPLGHDLVNPKAFLSGLVPKVSLDLCQKWGTKKQSVELRGL